MALIVALISSAHLPEDLLLIVLSTSHRASSVSNFIAVPR